MDSEKYSDIIQRHHRMQKELSQGKTSWDDLWKQNNVPWDKGTPSPALQDLLESKRIEFKEDSKVLVPGCGGGYDVFYFSKFFSKVIGIDLSETAIANCQQKLSPNATDHIIEFKVQNFFDLQESNFDIIYDYTFLCALRPEQRQAWAKKVSELLSSDGHLITLMFPISDDPPLKGPPFNVNVSTYQDLLSTYFDNLFVDECRSFPERQGAELIAVWKKK